MKKYYVKEIPSEDVCYDNYYGEDQAIEDDLWLGGNRDFCTFNKDLRKDVADKLTDLYAEFVSLLDEELSDEDLLTEKRKLILEYWPNIIDTEKQDNMIGIVEEFDECAYRDENQIICNALYFIKGKEFITGTLCGCCQGDWLEYICPENLKPELSYIEAVFFGTGTEFMISCDKLESADELDDADHYFDYTDKYGTTAIKEHFAAQLGCTVDDIVLLTISGQHTYTKYDYKED